MCGAAKTNRQDVGTELLESVLGPDPYCAPPVYEMSPWALDDNLPAFICYIGTISLPLTAWKDRKVSWSQSSLARAHNPFLSCKFRCSLSPTANVPNAGPRAWASR